MSWRSSLEGLSTFGGSVDVGRSVGSLANGADYIVDVENKMAVYKVKAYGRQVIESKE